MHTQHTKKQSALLNFAIPIGVFAVMAGLVLLVASSASGSRTAFDVVDDTTDRTGVRVESDENAFGGTFLGFRDNRPPTGTGTLGDGYLGGKDPWTPPVAPLPVPNPADAGGVTTVASGCTPNASCVAKIQALVNSSKVPALRITVGSASQPGQSFNFEKKLTFTNKTDVFIDGLGQPTFKVKANLGGSLVGFTGNNSNISMRGFDFDMGGKDNCKSASVFSLSGTINRLFLQDLTVENAGKNVPQPADNDRRSDPPLDYCENDYISMVTTANIKDIYVTGNKVSRLRRFVRVKATLENAYFLNNEIREIGIAGYDQTFEKRSKNVYIDSNIFSKHSPVAGGRVIRSNPNPAKIGSNVGGGHMIAFPISKARTPIDYATNVYIRNNLVEGRPNVSHLKYCTDGEGITGCGGVGLNGEGRDPSGRIRVFRNGAAGDLIAIRGVNGFELTGNIVRHGGEVGLTTTAGLKNGIIANNQVSYTDTTGIALGNESKNGNETVRNISVYDNEFFENALDRDLEYDDRTHPAFSVWNTEDVCIVRNNIHDNWKANGLWIYNGQLASWKPSVFRVHIEGNTFERNERDIVTGVNHLDQRVYPADVRAGEPPHWTVMYPGAAYPGPDSDNDGLPNKCFGE